MDLNVDQHKNDETRNVQNFDYGDLLALRPSARSSEVISYREVLKVFFKTIFHFLLLAIQRSHELLDFARN